MAALRQGIASCRQTHASVRSWRFMPNVNDQVLDLLVAETASKPRHIVLSSAYGMRQHFILLVLNLFAAQIFYFQAHSDRCAGAVFIVAGCAIRFECSFGSGHLVRCLSSCVLAQNRRREERSAHRELEKAGLVKTQYHVCLKTPSMNLQFTGQAPGGNLEIQARMSCPCNQDIRFRSCW